MAEELAATAAVEIGKEIIQSIPTVIAHAKSAPEQYRGLEALGYGISKEAPYLDITNKYPEAHPGYWESSPGISQALKHLERKTEGDYLPVTKVSKSERPMVNRYTASTSAPVKTQDRYKYAHSKPQVKKSNVSTQAPIPTHETSAHVNSLATYGTPFERRPRILNPFTGLYIGVAELNRLSKKNDSEGRWAKKLLPKYFKYLSNKK